MHQAFVYRLYPSEPQQRRLEQVRETCRRFYSIPKLFGKWVGFSVGASPTPPFPTPVGMLYNDCLAERKTAYQERGETISKILQLRRVKEHKATNPFAKDVHSHILQIMVDDLDKAFQAFFRRVKAG